MLEQKKEIKSFKVFLVCVLMGMLIILPYLIQSEGFMTLVNDYNYQQIPFNVYCIESIKSGNVLWDWNTDLGGNFLGNYAFYTLGSPFFWILSFFPSGMVPYLLGPLLALKYGTAGVTAYWYLKRYTKQDVIAFGGAVLYAFSGFQAGNTIFYHFHDAVAFFPLLLIGIDKLIDQNKKGFFALAVAINAMTNYFFFAGEVIFLGIYFFSKILWNNRSKIKIISNCLLEGIIGIGISCFIFFPAIVFILRNPRVSSHIAGKDLFVYDAKYYIRIIKALLLPMEAMTSNSSLDSFVFSSTSLYLPMVGIVLVICFIIADKKKEHRWIKGVLAVCVVMALLPVLNSSFYAFTSNASSRWFFMPILIMALASIKALELEKIPLGKVIGIWSMLFVVLIAALLNPLGAENYILHKIRFLLQTVMTVTGVILTVWLLWRKNKGKSYLKVLIVGLMFYSVLTTSYVLLVMRDVAPVIHSTDGVKAFHEAAEKIQIPDTEENWRVMYSKNNGNLSLLMNVPSVNVWNSTVSGEIFKFYSLLGKDREFESPSFELTSEAGKALLSIKYEIVSNLDEEDVKNERPLSVYNMTPFEVSIYEKGYGLGEHKKYTNQFQFYLYKNDNFLPIGFSYEFYITEEELLRIPEEKRLYAMLRALVLSEADAQKLGDYVQHIEESSLSDLDDEHMLNDIRRRREVSSVSFTHDTASIYSTIVSDKKNVAFFSVPYDHSWRAYVNGKEVTIMNTGGMMCVPLEKGNNDIVFKYLALDNLVGGIITVISILAFICYMLLFNKENGKKIVFLEVERIITNISPIEEIRRKLK